jgi:hypothetical protein
VGTLAEHWSVIWLRSTSQMIRFAQEASDDEIRDAIRQWIDLLVADRYEDAHEMLFRLPNDPWTPDLMRTVVRNYGFSEPRDDGQTFRVTARAEAIQKKRFPPSEDVEWWDDGEGVAHFDLPLNGEWSDVTAIIDIFKHGTERVLRLNDIDVL